MNACPTIPMYLKRLELHGFKTFAERTELAFGPGITAIVGPNGSGKSNISDSILWVLGEQALKALRSAKSTDVIFNGSEERKAVGYAEVHLTLDNSMGRLNFDGIIGKAIVPEAYSEVTVTRRVFRSGDSEFLINRVPVRLRDVQDLFLDTGIGRGSYSIISQGEVDAVLSSRAEERRALFEEAAGIARYRARKKEAVRKLEQVTQHLLRVRDIISELEGQVGPLAEQCEAAREYQTLHEERTTLQLSLLAVQYQGLQNTLQRAREREAEGRRELEAARAKVLQLEAEEAAQRLALQKMEDDLEERRGVESRLSNAVLTAEGALQLLAQQAATAQAEIDRLAAERAELLRQEAVHAKERASGEAGIHEAEAAMKAQEEALATAEGEVGGAAEQIAALDAEVQTRREAFMDIMDRAARVRNDLAAVESLLRTSGGRAERIATERAEVEAKQAEAKAALTTARAAVTEAQAAREAVVKARKAVAAARGEALQRAAELRAQESAAREELAGLRARLRTLKELEESHEGYYPGVRAALAAAKAGKLPGWYAPIGTLLDVPAGLEVAVEVALGANLQDVACNTEAEAHRGIEFLKQTGSGRATFLALDLLNPAPRAVVHSGDSAPRSVALPAPGVLGIAMDLVTFDQRYTVIAQHLLGRIIVVEDLDAALALSRSGAAKGWKSIVTREGELVTPARAITGGSPGKGAGLLTRRRELQELTGRVETLERNANGLHFKAGEAAADVARLEAEQNELAHADEAAIAAIAAAEQKVAALAHEVTSCTERLTALAEETTWLTRETSDARAEAERHNTTLNGLETAQKEAEAALATAEAALTGGRSERDAAAERLTALRVELSEARGVLYSRQAALRRAVEMRDAGARKLQTLTGSEETVQGQMTTLQAQQAEAEGELQRLREAFTHRSGELDAAKAERAAALEAISATLEGQRSAREQAEECSERLHRTEMRITQVETEAQYMEAQLFEDYRLTPDQAVARAVPVENRGAAVARLKELQSAEEALGTVNLGAIEEFERIRERLDFLSGQRADLEQSRSDLTTGIVEIEKTCREKFMAAFSAIAKEFQDLFVRLFGGGTTSLTLEDASDVLESGIEVHVTIPGKKNQHLLQLSGGERALTALALLFAMLRYKPSPFVVLDEIDAPLDEANVGRYCEVLKDFTRDTQFLIITHNKGTMEAADVLYGVTMEKAGVSRIVSVRLTEAV